MTNWKIVYSHGRDGHPWNDPRTVAIKAIADDLNIDMDSIPYDEKDSVPQMIEQAFEFCSDAQLQNTNLILIGSSRGAYIASAVTHLLFQASGEKTAGIYLMAPAIGIKPDYYPGAIEVPVASNIEVVHPYSDEIVPVQNTINFCTENNFTLHLVDDTHTLQNQVSFIESSTRVFIKKCLLQSI